MILSGSSYSAEHVRNKAKQRPEKLLTDRSAYILYLESQLERVTAACLTVHSFDEQLEAATSRVQALEKKVLNTGRLARCVQEDAQEAAAAQQSAINRLEQRLAALEQAVAQQPGREEWRALQEAVCSGTMLQQRLAGEGHADGLGTVSHLETLISLLTPQQAGEVTAAVGGVQSAFAEIRASLADMRRSCTELQDDGSGNGTLEQKLLPEADPPFSPNRYEQQARRMPPHPTQPLPPPQQRTLPPPQHACEELHSALRRTQAGQQQQSPPQQPAQQRSWPHVEREQVDSPGRSPVRRRPAFAAHSEVPQPRSSWPPAQGGPVPSLVSSLPQRMPHSQHAVADRDSLGGGNPQPPQPRCDAESDGGAQQRPAERQSQWHWRAEAAALQVETAARRRQQEAADRTPAASSAPACAAELWGRLGGGAQEQALLRDRGHMQSPASTQFCSHDSDAGGASIATGGASIQQPHGGGGTFADENQQAKLNLPCQMQPSGDAGGDCDSSSPQKWSQPNGASVRRASGAGGADAQRQAHQRRLEQLYEELQLLGTT